MNRVVYLLCKGIRDLSVNKWEQGVTLLALTLLLFLGLLFLLVVFNVRQQVVSRQGEMSFEVYWDTSADPEEVRAQWGRLRERDLVRSLATYTQGEALASLSRALGEADLDWLKGSNPLPPTAVVRVGLPDRAPRERVRELVADLEDRPEVQRVSVNSERLRRASTWTRLSGKALYPFLIGVVFLVALIMGNTFKLNLHSKREEVEVLRLVGAGRWFIQLPLLVGAVTQAAVGGALALALLKLAQNSLNQMLNVAPLWIELEFLPPGYVAAFFGALLAVALLSSWVAIRES